MAPVLLFTRPSTESGGDDMKAYTATITAITLALAAGLGCPIEDEEIEACPQGVELTGDELACRCAGETVDALPGDNSICSCDRDEGLICEAPITSCEFDMAFHGEELPCLCDGELIDALPGDGSDCRCDEAEGFVCEPMVPRCEPMVLSCEGFDVTCGGAVVVGTGELPCMCNGELIDTMPDECSECWCDEDEGFVCHGAIPSCYPDVSICEFDTAFHGDELPCMCNDHLINALPGDGSECWCDEDEGFVCEPMAS